MAKRSNTAFGCLLLGLALMAGCASQTTSLPVESTVQSGNLHAQVERLARQLFDTSGRINPDAPLAVGTILPSHLQNGKSLPEFQALGVQIQESLVTFSTQAGLNVVEFKALPAVHITAGQDVMLSRDVEALSSEVNLQYLLTGTYSEQEQSLLVNLRLIELPSKRLLAAATDYLPKDVAWAQGKVTSRNQMLYRGEY
ncbi:FlgO family outer membrane protein [Bowmanella yangjiangensis]|uniref:FlgO family outer membrane protein n=1 Tax=Bowmanella yangjiangensis TaxID=2811230 RepID=UPI001E39ED57|nr:FlgO family outer membrane protein [Bowmanella yangjiangensis]